MREVHSRIHPWSRGNAISSARVMCLCFETSWPNLVSRSSHSLGVLTSGYEISPSLLRVLCAVCLFIFSFIKWNFGKVSAELNTSPFSSVEF